MVSTDDDGPTVPRIIPPLWNVLWSGVQIGLTVQAGGRRRFRGQAALAGLLGAGGLVLGATALGLFARAGTTWEPHRPAEATTLVTSGLYAYTRNPMYCSILLILLGNAVWSGRLRTLIALPGLVLSLQPQIETEERVLTTLFGDEYEAYRAAVPRWI